MPGIPRTKRCQRCRKRKIKCDEQWPTCTPCKQSDVVCSGPPTLAKFVNNGRHDVEAQNAVTKEPGIPQAANAQWVSMVNVSSSKGSAGESYGRLRLVPRPRVMPTTLTDRIAARYVAQFSEDPSHDFMRYESYPHLLPARLGESAALRDCVAFFCSAWTNFRRGIPMNNVIDEKMHGKSIRSLRRGFSDPKQLSSYEILAAVVLMERLEYLFETERNYYRTMHSHGIFSFLAQQGPSSLTDDLSVAVVLDSQPVVQAYCLAEGIENVCHSPTWSRFFDHALNTNIGLSGSQVATYKVERLIGRWPPYLDKNKALHSSPRDDDFLFRALAFRLEVTQFTNEIHTEGPELMGRLYDLGQILEVPASDMIVDTKYDFTGMFAQRCFVDYYWLLMIMNRMTCSICQLLGEQTTELDVEFRDYCRRVWMCLPFIEQVGLLAQAMFTGAFYMSYWGANEDEKDYLLEHIRMSDKYRRKLPTETHLLVEYLQHMEDVLIGRVSFTPPKYVHSESGTLVTVDDNDKSQKMERLEDWLSHNSR